MTPIPLTPDHPQRLVVGGAPEGQDARLLAELAQSAPAGVLHIVQDDARMAALADIVGFFAPSLPLVLVPAWDCLPYDRVSPNAEIASRRVEALARLAAEGLRKRLVIATVAAATQRVPPRARLARATFSAVPGTTVQLEALLRFLADNGYVRTETVREPGEFAVRGGIVDLYPPGEGEPVRLDLFGDELEKIRSFDPMSQRTTGSRERLDLTPVSEVFLDEASVARFRTGYRQLFGAVLEDDPLYEAIGAGRRYAGMEHWLPLFHAGMETLLDYLPRAVVTFDPQAEEARRARLAQVQDFFQARIDMQSTDRKAGAPTYKPLPPDLLFLDDAAWGEALADRAVGFFQPFAVEEGAGGGNRVDGGARRTVDFSEARANPDLNVFDAVAERLRGLVQPGRRVLVTTYTNGARERLRRALAERGLTRLTPVGSWQEALSQPAELVGLAVVGIEHGFLADDLAVITEPDILGDRLVRPQRRRRRKTEQFLMEVTGLAEGDLVVHQEHGIGRFEGLETIVAGDAPHDCVRVAYDGNSKLYVPVENIEVLSRFGSEQTGVALDRLGGGAWQARKARVKQRLKDMAEALLKIAAERILKSGEAVVPPERAYDEFCARFPYAETEDQLKAIEDVLTDLASGRPMDRLVCGDVGFGKTEVALRAAFVAALSGRQVAVVVPTTLLARQHFATFAKRCAGFPVRVEQLSRLVTAADTKKIKAGLEAGQVDIVVGTHAVLGQTVKFKDLGLVIVDEEQHFGVKQKERLKQLRADVHVLTLTATPIPRTLQLSLAGVRELSIIATPPVDRLAVRTFVLPFDPVVIREAILREHFRGGQSFCVCPRIEDLASVEERLTALVPEIKIVTAHGQMAAAELEERMTAFDEGKFDLLLATNIIESGLDIPRANTMVIHRADLFGLAQLYQLRGRIGRSKLRGYAYLTWQPGKALTKPAEQRLRVLETLDTLGAGFQLASYDLDIRGAGNLLGEEQSGHIKEVGIELYQQMLEQAVAAAKEGGGLAAEGLGEKWTPQINLGLPVLIPEGYVPDLNLRMSLYRRLAELETQSDVDSFGAELVDRFGPLPDEAENLLTIVVLKQLCRKAGVERLDAGPRGALLTFRDGGFGNVEGLIKYLQKHSGTAKLRPDQKLVFTRGWEEEDRRVKDVLKIMRELAAMAA